MGRYWWAFVILPAVALAYTPPTKAPIDQAVQSTQIYHPI